MSFITSIANIFTWVNPVVEIALLDSTEYRITTNTNVYHGIIIYQDAFSIKFQCKKNKTVKILKSNITQMSVVLTS